MSINLTLPGSLKAGDTRAFGGAYPIDDHGTGFNNVEWNGYPGAVNDRIVPVAHPIDPSRPVSVAYEVRPGDKQPHYPGSSGERAEVWPEPHDGVAGMTDAVCSSWVVPAGYGQMPSSGNSWAFILQNHPGENSASLSPWFGVNLWNGEIAVEAHYAKKVLGPVTPGREFFVAVRTTLGDDSRGRWDVWAAWDAPPDLTKLPWLPVDGPTLQGSPMFWKVGFYRSKESFTNRIVQTTFARRGSLAAAAAAAGWDKIGGSTPPPPDPPPALDSVVGSIANGATLKGKVSWTAEASTAPVTFLVDGSAAWTENLAPYVFNGDGGLLDTATLADGAHALEVRAGKASHVVSVTVKNAVTPPPPPPPADPCAQAKADLAAAVADRDTVARNLTETEAALEDATNKLELARKLLRDQITVWRSEKPARSWQWIQRQPAGRAYYGPLGGK